MITLNKTYISLKHSYHIRYIAYVPDMTYLLWYECKFTSVQLESYHFIGTWRWQSFTLGFSAFLVGISMGCLDSRLKGKNGGRDIFHCFLLFSVVSMALCLFWIS